MQDFEILIPLHLTLICDRTTAFFQSLQKPRGTSKQNSFLRYSATFGNSLWRENIDSDCLFKPNKNSVDKNFGADFFWSSGEGGKRDLYEGGKREQK